MATIGIMDDRWAFTTRQPYLDFQTAASLAAASRALRGYNNDLAERALVSAKRLLNEATELTKKPSETGDPMNRMMGRGGDLDAVLQLYITTKEQQYADRFLAQIWSMLDAPSGRRGNGMAFFNSRGLLSAMNCKSLFTGQKSLAVCLFLCLSWLGMQAQTSGDAQPASTNVPGAEYPRIDSQLRGTFRVNAPNAQKVELNLGKKYEMTKSADGVWMVTTDPLVVGFHYYTILIDGVAVADPSSESFFGGSSMAQELVRLCTTLVSGKIESE